MTRTATITEGKPNPDNSIELWVGHILGEWEVALISDDADQDSRDWPIDPLEEWLLELIGDLPETIDEARNDPRMYVSDRSKPCDMDRVNLSNNPVAHATYHENDEEWIVEVRGEEIAAESLPHVLSDEQDQIFLYNETVTLQSDEREQEPRTRRLTALTGIGEATARKLGDDITRIDELLDIEEGTLTDDVRSAVSAQYYDTLREEVRDWYRTARRNRSPDELEPINKTYLSGDVAWKDKPEDINGTDEPRLMCLLLRDEVRPNEKLRITTEEYGQITGQVIEKSDEEQTSLTVTIGPESTPLGAEGTIEVPIPYRGVHPVLIEKLDAEPAPTSSGESDSLSFIGRRKITKVEIQEKTD